MKVCENALKFLNHVGSGKKTRSTYAFMDETQVKSRKKKYEEKLSNLQQPARTYETEKKHFGSASRRRVERRMSGTLKRNNALRVKIEPSPKKGGSDT